MIGVKKDFDESLGEGDVATFEAIAVAPDGTRSARKGVAWSLYQLSERLPMVQYRRTLELRAGQVVEAHRRRDASTSPPTRRRRSARRSAGAAIGSTSNRPTAKRPASPSTSAGREPRAPTRPTTSSSRSTRRATRRARRPSCASPRVSPARRRSLWSATSSSNSSTSISPKATMSCRSTVGADWGAGAYAVALTHRPLDVKAKRMPGRALGLAWFAIDEAAHKLDVAINAPDKTRPRQPLTLPIKIGGLAAGEEARGHGRRGRHRHPQPHAVTRRRTRAAISSASASSPSTSATSTGC